MIEGELTHVSTVQIWECDSNAHMNIQFFHQRFREAGVLFRLRHGLPGVSMSSAHTRFHRELHVDDTATVRSIAVRDDTGAAFVMHQMTGDGTTLSCVSLDRLSGDTAGLVTRPLSDFPQAMPRGVPPAPTVPLADSAERVRAGKARVGCITHVLPSDMDQDGQWRAERVVSSFSNGGQSAWELIGGQTPWLRDRNLGRVVLELKLDRHLSPRPGAVLQQTSHCVELTARTYRFQHQIEDALSGTIHATGQVLSILMDHDSRRMVPIPDRLQAP